MVNALLMSRPPEPADRGARASAALPHAHSRRGQRCDQHREPLGLTPLRIRVSGPPRSALKSHDYLRYPRREFSLYLVSLQFCGATIDDYEH